MASMGRFPISLLLLRLLHSHLITIFRKTHSHLHGTCHWCRQLVPPPITECKTTSTSSNYKMRDEVQDTPHWCSYYNPSFSLCAHCRRFHILLLQRAHGSKYLRTAFSSPWIFLMSSAHPLPSYFLYTFGFLPFAVHPPPSFITSHGLLSFLSPNGHFNQTGLTVNPARSLS